MPGPNVNFPPTVATKLFPASTICPNMAEPLRYHVCLPRLMEAHVTDGRIEQLLPSRSIDPLDATPKDQELLWMLKRCADTMGADGSGLT